MRKVNALRWLLTAGALILSSIATAQVRISEFHYDNTGTDAGEAIEVSAPAGTDLTGWSIVLYNGLGGASYDTDALSGVVPATCGARGVVVLNYPANGIQNGSPDGIALVDNNGVLVEFISYEGVFAATNGVANGFTSIDIGVSENGSEPVGLSLARDASGTWSTPAANSFGACNDNGTEPPPPVVASITLAPVSGTVNAGSTLAFSAQAFDAGSLPIAGITFAWTSSNPAVASVSASGVATGIAEGDTIITATAANGVAGSAALRVDPALPPPPVSEIRVSEIHYDNSGVDAGEAIEIEGPAGATLTGFSLVLYNGTGGLSYNSQVLSGSLASCGNSRGVFVVTYPSNGIQNGSPDGIALVDPAGQVVEFISYEGVFTPSNGPAAGLASLDIGAAEASSSPIGSSLQRNATNVWSLATSTFGACNGDGEPPPPVNTIQFTGRVPSDPPLPVGYEDQIFATLRINGTTMPSTFTWLAETPAIATIEQNGVIRALTEGTAVFRATAADGTTATYALPTRVAVASGVTYPGNAEFGEPTDSRFERRLHRAARAIHGLVQPEPRLAQLGELRPRRRALRARGPLRLLHDGSGSAGFVSADLHQRLHRRRRVRGLRHRSRAHGALVRPHDGQPRQRAHLPVQQRRAADGRHEPGTVGDLRELPRRSRALRQSRGLRRDRRRRQCRHSQERGQGRHPDLDLESRGDRAA